MKKKSKKKIVLEPKITYIRNTESLKKLKLKAQFNKRVNIYIGKTLNEAAKDRFFKGSTYEDMGCIYLHYKTDQFWSTILRDLGIAKSISDAKGKGWHRKVEDGFQDIFLDGLKDITNWSWRNNLGKEELEEYETLTDEEKKKVRKDADYHNTKGYRPHRITILKESKDVKTVAKMSL